MTALSDYERDQRLECLKLAVESTGSADAVALARDFYAFVTGESDKSPREIIDAALDQANVS